MCFEFDKIKNLFKEKKYSELIQFIEKSSDTKKLSSKILNILGASKILDNNKDVNGALECFKKSYVSEKTSSDGLNGLINYIKTANSIKCYIEVETFINDAIDYFGNEKRLLKEVYIFYLLFNDINKSLYYLKKLVETEADATDSLISYIILNLYENHWKQDKFLEASKNLSNLIQEIKAKDLVPLKQNKNKKIKIGFLSADLFKNHSVTYFLKSVLSSYNKDKFELVFISNIKKLNEDETTNRFRILFDDWLDIQHLNDIEAINVIRSENLNVVIDLMGLTAFNRLALFKNRIAPVQISWLGYCNTTGLNEMDYLLADKNLIYKNEEKLYTEKVIYMPHIWNCHFGLNINRKIHSPFEKNKFITFGSFNNFLKISDLTIQTWAQILTKIKNSRLILKSSRHQEKMLLKKKFDNYGVGKAIFFEEKKNFNQHLELYKKIDIALDTFPYNGVTTSFEAIWMNVPVLTLKGNNFNSRCGTSINSNLGLSELISENVDDYIGKAVYLAKNEIYLKELKNKLFDNCLTSSLYNKELFSNSFYEIIENLLKDH